MALQDSKELGHKLHSHEVAYKVKQCEMQVNEAHRRCQALVGEKDAAKHHASTLEQVNTVKTVYVNTANTCFSYVVT